MKSKKTILVIVLLALCLAATVACKPVGGGTLSSPTIKLEGNVVSWQAVENATAYSVKIGSDAAVSVTTTSYTVDKTAVGSYKITVTATSSDGKWKESSPSNEVTYVVEDAGVEKTALATPVITLNGKTVSWQAVPNAASYDVKVGNASPVNVTTTSYTLPQTAVGSYKVTVVAKAGASETYKDSSPSNEVTYVIGEEVKAVLTEIDVDPVGVPATIYLDQGITELDLSQIVITAYYDNDTDKVIALTDVTIGEYDLTSIGRKVITVTYSEDGITADPFEIRVNVEERGIDDIDDYDTLLLECSDAGKYTIEGTAIRNMKGENMLDGGQVTLPQGKTLLSVDDKFVVVTVAKFVSSLDDFKAIADDMNAYYVLTKDIDFGSQWNAGAYIGAAPLDNRNYLDYENGVGAETTGEGRESKGQLGVAFNGTIDGQGYALKNIKLSCNEFTNSHLGRGLAIIGFLGENGVIENVTLRNVTLAGGKFNSFLVGYNKGTINNICVEADCSMTSAFNGGCLVAGYNDGKVSNVVSYVSQYTGWNNAVSDFVVANNNDIADDVTGVLKGSSSNSYIADKTDLTETLGAGWKYFEDLGTVIVNDNYIYVRTVKDSLSIGERWYLNLALGSDALEPNFAFYGIVNGESNDEIISFGWDGEKGSHYIEFTNPATAVNLIGTKITMAVYSAGWKTSVSVDFTVAAASVSGYEKVTETLNVVEGTDIDLTAIDITAKYTDGTTKTIHPTKVEGFDKAGTVGVAQTVKAYYGEGENDYLEIAVTLIAKSVESIEIDTASTYKTVYNVGDELDLTGLKIVVSYNNNTQETVDVTAEMLSEYDLSAAGQKEITVTYLEQTCTFTVNVKSAEVTLVSVEITGTPAKTHYKLDSEDVTLDDIAGVTLTATYSDLSSAPITVTLNMISYRFNTVGSANITVTYEGETAQIPVTVVDYATALNVTATATTLSYSRKSAALDLVANATYTLTMASGETKAVTSGITASEYKPGLNTITYTYTDEYSTVTATQQYEIWYEVYNFEGAGNPNTVDLADWTFMQNHLDGYFRLVEDLDFSGKNMTPLGTHIVYSYNGGDVTTCNPTESANATPKNEGKPFTGKFDGQDHLIKWANVTGTGWTNEGFGLSVFGYVGESGEVKNIRFSNMTIESNNQSAIVATQNAGLIENITIINDTGSVTTNYGSAGVIAYNLAGGTVRNVVCYKMSSVKLDGTEVNLPVVYNNNGIAEHCYAISDENFLEVSKALDGVDGWVYRDNVGPTREPFADIALESAEVAIDGEIRFTIKLGNATLGDFAIIRPVSGADNDVYYDITDNGDGSYTLTLSSKSELAERVNVGDKVTLLVSTNGAGYARAEVTITEAKEGL